MIPLSFGPFFQDDTDSGYSGTPPGGSAGFTLTKEEICTRIKLYNEKVGSNSNGAMTLVSDRACSSSSVKPEIITMNGIESCSG